MPPLLGATTVTVAWPSPATAVGVPGVPGAAGKAAVGVTELLVALALDVPALFVAVAVNVYEVPAVNPVTTQEVSGVTIVQVFPPGEVVTK